MSSTQEAVDVDVDISTVYNQWTQFTEFPRFMRGVDSITQTDDTRQH
ncbi:MAG: SRPBCC family protein, partial [Mycobacteriales bacterium]